MLVKKKESCMIPRKTCHSNVSLVFTWNTYITQGFQIVHTIPYTQGCTERATGEPIGKWASWSEGFFLLVMATRQSTLCISAFLQVHVLQGTYFVFKVHQMSAPWCFLPWIKWDISRIRSHASCPLKGRPVEILFGHRHRYCVKTLVVI